MKRCYANKKFATLEKRRNQKEQIPWITNVSHDYRHALPMKTADQRRGLSVAFVREGAVRTSLYQNRTLWRVCLPAADQGTFAEKKQSLPICWILRRSLRKSVSEPPKMKQC